MFFKIGVLKNFAIFTRQHLCWNLFLIQLQSSTAVNIAKFLRMSILKNICERLLLKFNESAFWSWNIIILNLLWRTYFMCILLSDCTNTFVIRIKIEELKSDCPNGSMNNLVWRFKKWDPQCEKRKTSSWNWPCELDEGCSLLEINCILWT